MGKAQATAKIAAKAADTVERPPRRWFGLVPPATDRSVDGFVRAVRAAFDTFGGDDPLVFNSPDDLCDAFEELIRRRLNGAPYSITVRWNGSRARSRKTSLVISTSWGLREDVEHGLSFQLFRPGEATTQNAPAVKQGR
jgi:hypothetical protein